MTDTASPVAAGVIGVGSMGRNHARVYDELADADLVGVFDVDDARAAEVAERNHTVALSKAAILDAADVVSVAVPTTHHHAIARECIEAGVHVLVEKPFVAHPDEGRALIDLADEHGVTIQVGHIERFNPAVGALGDILDDQEIIAVDARRLSVPPERNIKDSAAMDLMIHDIDILLSMIDAEVDVVNAVGTRENRYIDAQLRFTDSVVASLTASRLTQKKVRELSITTEESLITVDYINQSVEVHRQSLPEYVEHDGNLHYRHEGVVERPLVESGEELKRELAAFVAAVTEGTTPIVTAADGVRALEVARRIDDLAAESPPLVGVDGG